MRSLALALCAAAAPTLVGAQAQQWTPPLDCPDGSCRTGSGDAAAARNTGPADPAGIPTRKIAVDADGADVMMPVISLGAAHFGGDGATTEVVNQWFLFGGRGIDTSGDYRTEPEVGVALRAQQVLPRGVPREEMFITSKLSQQGMASYEAALQEFEETLVELNTDFVDLFLIHRAGDSQAQRRETWRAMQHLRDTGKAKAIGVSNWGTEELDDIVLDPNTVTQPAVNQVKFHAGMWTRDGAEHQTKRYCDQKGITFEAYSPLGVGGVLSDADLVQIAAAHGKSPAQVALKWLVQHGAVACPGADTLEYMTQDADLFSWELTDLEMRQIDGIQMSCDRRGTCTYSDAPPPPPGGGGGGQGGRGGRGGRGGGRGGSGSGGGRPAAPPTPQESTTQTRVYGKYYFQKDGQKDYSENSYTIFSPTNIAPNARLPVMIGIQ